MSLEVYVPQSIVGDRDLATELHAETFSWVGQSRFEVTYGVIARSAEQAHARASRLVRAALGAIGIERASVAEVVVFESEQSDADQNSTVAHE